MTLPEKINTYRAEADRYAAEGDTFTAAMLREIANRMESRLIATKK